MIHTVITMPSLYHGPHDGVPLYKLGPQLVHGMQLTDLCKMSSCLLSLSLAGLSSYLPPVHSLVLSALHLGHIAFLQCLVLALPLPQDLSRCCGLGWDACDHMVFLTDQHVL